MPKTNAIAKQNTNNSRGVKFTVCGSECRLIPHHPQAGKGTRCDPPSAEMSDQTHWASDKAARREPSAARQGASSPVPQLLNQRSHQTVMPVTMHNPRGCATAKSKRAVARNATKSFAK